MSAFIAAPFRKKYSQEEIMTDARWLLLLLGACGMFVGLLQAILSHVSAILFLSLGVVFTVFAVVPLCWPRVLLLGVWGFGLLLDLAIRRHLLSLFFLFVAIHHVYYLLRYGRGKKLAVQQLRGLSVLLLWSLGAWLAAPSLSADVIEVRGKGSLNGTIIREDEETLTFQNSWGEVDTFPRRDVTVVDRAPLAPQTSEPQGSRRGKPLAGPARDKARPTHRAREMPTVAHAPPARAQPVEEQPLTVLQQVDAFANRVLEVFFRTLLTYWVSDEEEAMSIRQTAMADTSQLKGLQTGAFEGNYTLCAVGMGMMALGAIATAVSGFVLLFVSLNEGVRWGAAVLGSFIAYSAPLVGGFLGLLLLTPLVAAYYFIITRWRIVRRPIIVQLFSIDLLLLGYVVLRTTL